MLIAPGVGMAIVSAGSLTSINIPAFCRISFDATLASIQRSVVLISATKSGIVRSG